MARSDDATLNPMEPADAAIPVRSRRQAMDWSLVLVSQGIETTIEGAGDGGGFRLLVPAKDYTPALKALRAYQIENRHWQWQQEVFRPGLLFDWGSLAWAVLLALFFWCDARLDLQSVGLMDSAAVSRGQWWRLFTAVWLHDGAAHLTSNTVFGILLVGLAMGRYGTGAGLLAAYLAGAGGNVTAWLAAVDRHLSLGASGMVMGGLGLLAAQSFSLWRETPRARKYILTGLGGGIMLFMLLGLGPGTDVLAHLGGFLSGLLLGGLLSRIPHLSRKVGLNFLCGLIFALLTILPWWLALRSRLK
jgi:rhomboid protease GluP